MWYQKAWKLSHNTDGNDRCLFFLENYLQESEIYVRRWSEEEEE